jgi:predicted GNAT superfamily acetyltransferase
MVRIRLLDGQALAGTLPLAAAGFGFGPEERIPRWLMHTTNSFGGFTLGAYAGSRLIGYAYGVPAFDGRESFVLVCGVAVDPAFESRGVGERLKRAERDEARRRGYRVIRWTTTPLGSRQLYLYLSKLSARIVRYHERFYDDAVHMPFPDEVEIEWPSAPQAAVPRAAATGPALTVTADAGDGHRRLQRIELDRIGDRSHLVEIPWDRARVSEPPQLAREWLLGVRTAMQQLLANGYRGTAVVADRACRRSFVRFDR